MNPSEDHLMTVKEVAQFLKVTERTVLKYIHEHKIVAIKIGKDWRISASMLFKWIQDEFSLNEPTKQPSGAGG